MDVAILVAHEVEIAGRYGDGLGADAEKAADVDDDPRIRARPVDMVDAADLFVVGSVDRGVFEKVGVSSAPVRRT